MTQTTDDMPDFNTFSKAGLVEALLYHLPQANRPARVRVQTKADLVAYLQRLWRQKGEGFRAGMLGDLRRAEREIKRRMTDPATVDAVAFEIFDTLHPAVPGTNRAAFEALSEDERERWRAAAAAALFIMPI